ncbi:formylglycine-generating enzyme family protein [Enhygromyxa salina]|uniref:Iron(II)-dependent oxidoreductase EgtB n=1 Tax=Enhygromyxa salina TaxID=215803 RepID=A0A2S9YSQ3_9BACT|nr:SUMF1/EgtB/PvdO family nonheme iron enzyme [Enhygromyxa salina]PRQ08134.1 Iron(II)-dependent oxidoreductase EgtB [Enhygromyxa salina]
MQGDGDGDPGDADGDLGDGAPGDGDLGDGDGDGHEPPCESMHEGMICIPAGPFIMGSNGLGFLEEREIPEQVVYLSQFHIDRHEVTFGEYRLCVEAGKCSPPAAEDPNNDLTFGCRWGNEGIDTYPVACVDWLQALEYCNARGAELPTEAQWEKAGRGTDGRDYAWGNEAPTCFYASMASEPVWGEEPFELWGCGTGMPERPGSHSPQGDSPYGVQDMVGNVGEITADWLAPGQPNLGTDPTGPDSPGSGSFKVWKGGTYISSQLDDASGGYLHLAWRAQGGAGGPGTGFRCAVSE